jgi:hypothetical protein
MMVMLLLLLRRANRTVLQVVDQIGTKKKKKKKKKKPRPLRRRGTRLGAYSPLSPNVVTALTLSYTAKAWALQ